MVETKNVKKVEEKVKDWLYNEDDFMCEVTLEDNRGLYTKRMNKPARDAPAAIIPPRTSGAICFSESPIKGLSPIS